MARRQRPSHLTVVSEDGVLTSQAARIAETVVLDAVTEVLAGHVESGDALWNPETGEVIRVDVITDNERRACEAARFRHALRLDRGDDIGDDAWRMQEAIRRHRVNAAGQA